MDNLPPVDVSETPAAPIPAGDRQWAAIAALVIGVVNLCAWLVPFCGIPLAVIGIILGVLGLKTPQRTLAIIGIALCALAFVLGVVASVLWGVAFKGLPSLNFPN